MSTPFYLAQGASELSCRYAFLEALIAGKRVLEVGAVASTGGRSAAVLRARGARRVVALDADPGAVEDARRRHAGDPELQPRAGRLADLEDGPFDLVFVADAAPLVRVPSELDLLARLVAPDGHAVLGLRNPAGPSLASLASEEPRDAPPTWGELAAALQARFASVEAAAQSAFVGYRLSPAAPGDWEAAVDATLVEPEEPAYFLAVCGAHRCPALNAEAIVALPAAPLVVAAGRRAELAARLSFAEQELERLRSASPEAQAPLAERVRELEADLEAAHARARRLERDVETLTALERTARQRAEQAEDELARRAPPSPGPGSEG